MESGIKAADQNFYARRPVSTQQQQQQQQIHQHQHRPEQRTYEPPPLPKFEPDPQLPPKLPFLTTANLNAVTTNGYVPGGLIDGGADPAEFYRDYRGVTQSPSGYTDTTTNGMATATDTRPTPSSLRSNGNGTTAKHPPIPARGVKNSYRSVSSPLDNTMALSSAKSSPALNGIPKTGGQSVKDLLKRFDQNNEPSNSTIRKPVPRLVTKDGASPSSYTRDRVGYGYMGRTAGNSQNTSPITTTSRAGTSTRGDGAGRKSPEKLRTTQRTRFAPEDQHSNNTLSSVPRSTRPRNTVSESSSQASKSLTNLSPTNSSANSYIPPIPAKRPLFGEVLPLGPGSDDIGYGISNAATRRTSDSNLHPTWQRQRSRSEVDVSPSSPTAWYMGVTPALDDVDPNKQPRSLHGHNRNHSDFADTKANTMNGVTPDFESPVIPSLPILPILPPKVTKRQISYSRLPISTKRLSNSSGSSSPTSTRASSPLTSKSYSNGKLRKTEQNPWSPAGRDSANTPTQRSPRGKAKKAEPPPSGASLKAYISAPISKTSPPLRSSHSRQPVSSASTNGTRQKTVSPPQVRSGMKITRTNGPSSGFEDTPTRKIVDNGAPDFEGARNKIRRAYTKSIHESEQREIRAENLRRLNDRTARDSLEAAGKESAATQSRPETPPPVPTINHRADFGSSPPAFQTPPQPSNPLQISTTFFKDDQSPMEGKSMTFEDSPTLGMPGSFVDDDEAPASAISNATEIENEPQTEAARLRRLPSTKRKERSRLSYNVLFVSDELSPEQALYGMAQDDSIDIKLAPASIGNAEPTPAEEVPRDPTPPGAFQDDSIDESMFTTKVVTASPEETSPENSRPAADFKSADVPESNNLKAQKEPTLTDAVFTPQIHGPPEISLPHKADAPIDEAEVPRLQLPDLRAALAPLSVASNEGANDYLNTPVTEMDYESSDGAGATNSSEPGTYPASYETARDPVPSSRGHRSSHQSSWTEYSVDSTQEYSEQEDHQKPHLLSRFNPASRSHSPIPPVPPKPDGYSPQPSPRFSITSPSIASPSQSRLPPLVTDDDFGFGFAEQTFASVPLWPEYAPPTVLEQQASYGPPTREPPQPGVHNERPLSSFDQSSHNDASQSRRPSDDVYSPRPSVSTPRSSTQISFEEGAITNGLPSFTTKKPTLPETEAEREAAKKLEKRLFQRQMLIRELIDTESNYLKDMNVVEEIYKGTAEACPKLEPGDIKMIFRNTDQLVAFTTIFLDELRSAATPVYCPRPPKARSSRISCAMSVPSNSTDRFSVAATLSDMSDEEKDRKTTIGKCFRENATKMQAIYTDFLKNQDVANARLAALQTDSAVCVWLNECNTVAKDLTQAWDIDSLLVKPLQRVTRFPLLLREFIGCTDESHPDYADLMAASAEINVILQGIQEMKARIQMVGEIVRGRRRKESNVRLGMGKVFGQKSGKKERDESQTHLTATRDDDDPVYLKLHEKYCDNYLRMQVVLRDVEFYVRQCVTYVNDDLRYKSAMELVMRLSASPWPEIESKWARFNMSMRDMGTVALDQHTGAIRAQVIEPFEQMIQLYVSPGLAMKKRTKRRADYEKIAAAKKSGSKLTEKEQTKLEQYEALNETLKLEMPKLFEKTEEIANLLLGHFIAIQARWYDVWQKKVKVVLEESQIPKDVAEIVSCFNRDYQYVEGKAQELGIVNGTINLERVSSGGKPSTDTNDTRAKERKPRPSDLSSRSRRLSTTSDKSPSLPTPDFAKRNSGSQFMFSPITSITPSVPQFAYQNQSYQNQPYSTGHSRAGSGSPATPDTRQHAQGRPNTSRSYTSDSGAMRMSNDYNSQIRRESGSTSYSHVDGPPISSRPYSGIFHSAMPLPDGPEDSARSSRASSRDRNVSGGYNVLYLAASLFEFNIAATKSEAGYPYLTYQAGEIFDVIGEKGELWLAKNQDDPSDQVGWIWSKHFARLATD